MKLRRIISIILIVCMVLTMVFTLYSLRLLRDRQMR